MIGRCKARGGVPWPYYYTKPRSELDYNFRWYKNNIVNPFVNSARDARIASKGIWGKQNDRQAGIVYEIIILNVSDKYITFWTQCKPDLLWEQ